MITNNRLHHQTLFGILEDIQNEQEDEHRQRDETASSSSSSQSNHGNESKTKPIMPLGSGTDKASEDDDIYDDIENKTAIATATTSKTDTTTTQPVEVDLSTYIKIVSELKENNFLLETLIFSSIDGGGGDVKAEIASNLEVYSNPNFLQYLAQLLEDSTDLEEQAAYQELIDIIEDYSI